MIFKGRRVNSELLAKWTSPLQQYRQLLVLLLLCLVLHWLTPSFATWANLKTVARQISINGILAVGVTYVLLTGGVDLSLGSVVALSGVVAAKFAHPDSWPLIVPV